MRQTISSFLADFKLFTSGVDLPPVKNKLQTVRLLILSFEEENYRKQRKIKELITKWRKKGYDIIFFCARCERKPISKFKNFTIIRRGNHYSFFLFIFLYSLGCFPSRFDLIVCLDSRFHLFMPLIKTPIILIKKKKRHFENTFWRSKAKEFFFRMLAAFKKKRRVITISASSLSRLNMVYLLKTLAYYRAYL